MKVIDLLNKMANGEIDEETRYKFSPFDYCTIKEFFNRYIVDEENLNLEITRENKIEKIPNDFHFTGLEEELAYKINEIIDKINNMEDEL